VPAVGGHHSAKLAAVPLRNVSIWLAFCYAPLVRSQGEMCEVRCASYGGGENAVNRGTVVWIVLVFIVLLAVAMTLSVLIFLR
jgi:hypothetical protein